MKTYPLLSDTDSGRTPLRDSDDESENGEIINQSSLRRNSSFYQSLNDREDPTRKTDLSCLPLYLVALLFILICLPLALLQPPNINPPRARKSAALGITANDTHPHSLIVWSGMGYKSHLYNDLHEFDLYSRQWSKLSKHNNQTAVASSSAAAAVPLPRGRWKSAISQIQDGMLIFGGNAGATTDDDDDYDDAGVGDDDDDNDAWLLSLSTFEWSMQNESPSSMSSVSSPQPREGHSLISIPSSLASSSSYNNTTTSYNNDNDITKTKKERIVVFGGRNRDGLLLDDTWIGTVSWPNITWHAIQDQNDSKKKRKRKSPQPREGHSAVLRNDTDHPQMILFGGRTDENTYLNDIWILDIDSGEWEEVDISPGSIAPAPRDYHAAAFFQSQLLVFGGRYGPSITASRPLNDLWVFNFKTNRWNQAIQYGLRPLPRYMFSTAQFSSLYYVFGGSTLRNCKLNDLWSLNLVTLRWEQLSQPDFYEKKHCTEIFGSRR